MTRTRFNDGWTVGPNVSVFSEITGGATAAEPVTLPHDAMLAVPRSPHAESGASSGYFDGGAVVYRTSFVAPDHWRTRTIELEFHGVYRDAMVYLNGVLVGQRPSGYSPFRVRLDDALRYGEENRLRVDARAHRDSRWYSGLGIHRDVDLLDMPLTHLVPNGVRLTTPDVDESRAVVDARTEVENSGLRPVTVHVRTRILGPDGTVVATETSPITLRPGAPATVFQRLYVADPHLWSIERPALHRVETELVSEDVVIDTASTPLGIRKLQLDPIAGLRINGETVNLRGTCLHHDNGVLGAVSVADADRRRVRILKEAGFNAIRSAHTPAGPALLDACDELGMLVIDEAFDMWTEGKQPFDYSLAFLEWWERDLESMVTKDVNHPSVIAYSIGNEILDAGKPLGAAIGRALATKMRALDPSRFLTNGISGFVATLTDTVPMIQAQLDGVPGGINDVEGVGKALVDEIGRSQFVTDATAESHSVVDIVGHNYAEWRYEAEREQFPHRVVVGTETNPKDIAANWELVTRLPHVIGDFTWTGWDYLGEAGLGRTSYSSEGGSWSGNEYPALLAYCGDIDITGFRRPASHYREIVFGRRSAPFIAVHRPVEAGLAPSVLGWGWTDSLASWTWDCATGTPLTVDVYSDADRVELRLDGRPIGTEPAGAAHRFTASFVVPYEAGELTAVAIRDGVPSETWTVRSAGPASALRATVDGEGTAYVFIVIDVVDAADHVIPTAERSITVTVSGDGVLAGLGTGRPETEESYLSATCTTFEGRALAVIRRTGKAEAVVTVRSEGMEPASATVPPRD